MKHLSGLHLRMRDPQALAAFYTDHLGMDAEKRGNAVRLGYQGGDADLILLPGDAEYTHAATDRYWKIGLTVPDVDMAYAGLSRAGIPVSQPKQFRDIGYLCHLQDPAGLIIELLQHDFEGNRPIGAGNADLPLGGGARVRQITLRSTDIAETLACYEGLGMRILSIQPVMDLGFTLYFLAFTDDIPPDLNLTAVANREWLWKRPYTTLEIQHVPEVEITVNDMWQGVEVTGLETFVTDDAATPITGGPTATFP